MDPHSDLHHLNIVQLQNLSIETAAKISQLAIAKAAMSLVSRSPNLQIPLSTIGGPPGVFHLCQLIAYENLASPLPDLSMSPCSNRFLEVFRCRLKQWCTDEPSFMENILEESFK